MCVNRDREGWLLVENTRPNFENSLPKCHRDQFFDVSKQRCWLLGLLVLLCSAFLLAVMSNTSLQQC